MAAVLHLIKSSRNELTLTTIAQQLAAGDAVTMALLHGASPPPVPSAVRVVRVPHDISYDALLALIFASDHVVTW